MDDRDEPALRIEDGVLAHRRRVVLRGVNLDLRPGLTVVVGPNGAGKSTLLRALATLHPFRAGHLWVAGQPIRRAADVQSARCHIGYLEQNPDFPGRFTVREALEYAAWLHKVPDGRGRTEAVIERLALADVAGEQLRRLSGGTRHRALLGQAIVHDPQVVILDEPTAGMDVGHRLELRTTLADLATDRVVLLTTHVLDDIDALDATVVAIANQTLAYVGSVEALRGPAGPIDSTTRRLERALSTLASTVGPTRP